MAKTTSIHASLTEDQLQNWKLLEAFQRELEPRLAQAAASEPSAPERQLAPGAYLSMALFGLLNPALKSARALCAASQFKRMQAEVSGQPVKLASFSEMQHVCDPELLAGLLRDLSTRALPVFGEDRLRAQVQDLIVNDGTLLPALPRMAWALWQNPQNRAAKLHLGFSVWRQVPGEFTITAANTCERGVWKGKLKKGSFYAVVFGVADAGRGEELWRGCVDGNRGGFSEVRWAAGTIETKLRPTGGSVESLPSDLFRFFLRS